MIIYEIKISLVMASKGYVYLGDWSLHLIKTTPFSFTNDKVLSVGTDFNQSGSSLPEECEGEGGWF
jgi:hypothetical protein